MLYWIKQIFVHHIKIRYVVNILVCHIHVQKMWIDIVQNLKMQNVLMNIHIYYACVCCAGTSMCMYALVFCVCIFISVHMCTCVYVCTCVVRIIIHTCIYDTCLLSKITLAPISRKTNDSRMKASLH